MKLLTDIEDLIFLQSAQVKLLVHTIDAKKDQQRLRALGEATVIWLRKHEDAFYVTLKPLRTTDPNPANFRVLDIFPTRLFLIWGFANDSIEVVSEFKRKLKELHPQVALSAGVGDTAKCRQALLHAALDEAALFANEASVLSAAIVELRKEHQQTRTALQGLQDIVWSIRDNPPRITSATSISRQSIGAHTLDELGAAQLVQPLPVPGAGLAGVDVWIAAPGTGAGITGFVLTDTISGNVAGAWAVEHSSTREGWLHLSLPEVLSNNAPRMEIQARFFGPAQHAPQLGLSDENVVREYQLHYTGHSNHGHGLLATRTWAGFPGALNEDMGASREAAHCDSHFEYELPFEVLSCVAPIGQHHASFEYLRVDANQGILLHPLVDTEVGAVVRAAICEGATGVEATVSVAGACEATCEFAIAAWAPSEGTTTVPVSPDDPRCDGSSGWVKIGKNFRPERFALTLEPRTQDESLDLLLFTRIPGGQSVDFAHCLFHRLVIVTEVNKAYFLGQLSWDELITNTASGALREIPRRTKRTLRIKKLDTEQLNTAYPVFSFDVDYTYFAIKDDAEVMVHPVVGEVNSVCVPNSVPKGCTAIRADIAKGGPCEVEVELAMAYSETELIDGFSLDAPLLRTSSWEVLSNKTTDASIVFELPYAARRVGSLYLYSRAANTSSVDFADVYFRDITFTVAETHA